MSSSQPTVVRPIAVGSMTADGISSSPRSLFQPSSSAPSAKDSSTTPRRSLPLPGRPHPRLQLRLPPRPDAAEVLGLSGGPSGEEDSDRPDGSEDGEGQWFWYEGKRVYVKRSGKGARRKGTRSEESGVFTMENAEDVYRGDDGTTIADDEYDCGYALDLGAEGSPSISGSPSPGYFNGTNQGPYANVGARVYSFSSSSSHSASGSNSSLSLVSTSPSSLGDSLSRRNSVSRRQPGAGAVYSRDTETGNEAEERLLREWAVAVAGKGEVVTPPVAGTLAGRRSRGASLSVSVPPVTGSQGQVTRSRSASTGAVKWDETDRDCGICFEYAVRPARTKCCGKMFCGEHLSDWLTGPNASGLCPNCDAPCDPDTDVLSLAAPALKATSTKKSSHARTRSSGRAVPQQQETYGVRSGSSGDSARRVGAVVVSAAREDVSLRASSSDSPSSVSSPAISPSTSRSPTSPLHYTTAMSPTLQRSTPGHTSPSLLSLQQQYERLLAQEHHASSPLATRMPIVNPFDRAEMNPHIQKDDVLAAAGGISLKQGGRTRGRSVDLEGRIIDADDVGGMQEIWTAGVSRSRSKSFPSNRDLDEKKTRGDWGDGMWDLPLSNKGRVRDEGMWGRKDGVRSSQGMGDGAVVYWGSVKHVASLVLCLIFMYLVAR